MAASLDPIRRNNLFFTCLVLIVLYGCALPLVWFEYRLTPPYGVERISGRYAEIELLFRCPAWFLLTLSSLALLALGLNLTEFTRIPHRILLAVFAICGSFYLWGIFASPERMKPQFGIWVALVNNIAALALTYRAAFIPQAARVSVSGGRLSK